MIRAAQIVVLVGLVLCTVAVAGSLMHAGTDGVDPSAVAAVSSDPCCFTNPRYTGVCTVVPGEDESCASILGYLNNPNSTGKAYCGGTTVRGGWQQIACEDAANAFKAPDLR